MNKRFSLLRALTVVCTIILSGTGLTAAGSESIYVVVLNTSAGSAEPDIPALGGEVLHQSQNRRVVRISASGIRALAAHRGVKYIQRVEVDGSLPPLPSTPRVAATAVETNSSPSPTWYSGEYVYDGDGNITAIGTAASQSSDGGSESYVYDTATRLVQATIDHGTTDTEKYTYDSFGNLVDTIRTASPSTATPASPATNRLTGVTYDSVGNVLTEGGSTSYVYDGLNMMRAKVKSTETALYVYTADDERVGVCENGEQRWMIRDLSGKVLREWEVTGSVWMWREDHVYRNGALAAGEREPTEGGIRHFHLDHLGTPRLITDASATRIAAHDYFSFGLEKTDFSQEMLERGTSWPEPMKFTGHERDFTGGISSNNRNQLDYMHARHYNPLWGRFFSPDPVLGNLLQPQSWNRYAYVLNNPMNFIDPSGLAERKPGEKVEEGDTCDGKIVDGWCTGETITVEAKAPPIDWVSMSAGFGDGIIATMSFGLVSGHDLRKLTGADRVVDRCSQEYLRGRVGGTVVTLAAYAYGAIPATLTHFTTRGGAAAIQASGTVLPSTGLTLFGDGVYATAGSRLFVPAASTVPITMSGQGFMRIIPNAVFLKGGSTQTAAIFGAYGATANREAIGNPECD